MDKATLYSVMTSRATAWSRAIESGGTPQSALVGVAITPDLEIVFDTLKTTRKYANLVARPSCSFVLWWNGEQTVQFEGIAIEPQGADIGSLSSKRILPRGRTDPRACPGPASFIWLCDHAGFAIATSIKARHRLKR